MAHKKYIKKLGKPALGNRVRSRDSKGAAVAAEPNVDDS